MDQANFSPALFNQQQGDNPESMILTPGDFQAAFPGSVTSPGASLIPSLANYTGFLDFTTPPVASLLIQSPDASLIPSPANCAGFSGFAPPIASLPIQSPDASLIPSLANYAGFSGFAPPISSLPQSTIASPIPSQANYAALSEFERTSSTCLPPCAAYDLNHAEEAPAASIGYRSQTNEPSLPKHQSYYDNIPKDFPNYPLFNHAILPLDSNTVHQFGLRPYDGPKDVLSGFQQIPGPVNSNSRVCLRCRRLKQRCIMTASNGVSRCSQCHRQDIPASVCNRDHVIAKPFDRCLDQRYRYRSIWVESRVLRSSKMTQLGHYPNGPTLDVECCQFLVTPEADIAQNSVVRKNRSGWCWMPTPAYCLTNHKIDISPYLQECVRFSVDEACARRYPISFFFEQMRLYGDIPIIQQCSVMYTAFRLLRIGWQFPSGKSESESLGMATVKERNSMFYRLKCVPRMVQNQLNHALELKMMELDPNILKGAQRILEGRERRIWIVGFLALVFLLHIREVHAGRIIYWTRHDLSQFWDHSSSPTALIEEVVASCNSILSHFHCLGWAKPLSLNWGDKKSKDMVDNDSKIVKSMNALQAHVFKLKENGLISKKACELYVDGDPNSVEFAVVSLVFQNIKEGCEVKGFS